MARVLRFQFGPEVLYVALDSSRRNSEISGGFLARQAACDPHKNLALPIGKRAKLPRTYLIHVGP
jgi:hypothetical protein